MKFSQLINESNALSRYNKSKNIENVKESQWDIIKRIRKENSGDLFVSYRSIERLGINPNFKFKSPIGIYAYPIDYDIKNNTEKGTQFFGGDRTNFIYVFKLTNGKMLDNSYTENDLKIDIKKLKTFYPDFDFNNIDFQNSRYSKMNDGITRKISLNTPDVNIIPLTKIFTITYILSDKNPVKWNKLLRKLGYSGISDNGDNVINDWGRSETIFFSNKNLKIIEVINLKESNKNQDIKFKNLKWFRYANYKNEKIQFKRNKLIWIDGDWIGGNWEANGEWHNGIWHFGKWSGGIWLNGKWLNGYWLGGTWIKGVWIIGWIYDPLKKGNFEKDWEWKGDLVRSTINPKDYFKSH